LEVEEDGAGEGRWRAELSPHARSDDWAVLELEARFEARVDTADAERASLEIDIQTVGGPEEAESDPVVIVFWNGSPGAPMPPERRIHAVFTERSGGIARVDLGNWPAWCLYDEALRSIGFVLPPEWGSGRIVRAVLSGSRS
ncbi:MAG: hypothetical protein CME06_00245, partial [Gemmatimonadetes bacterium]|nr:hypothetical protein [Gemmatimonadota bacterium]